MTIVRRITTGFELGKSELECTEIGTRTDEVSASTAQKVTGSYSLCVGGHEDATQAAQWSISDTYQIRVGFHVRLADAYTAGNILYIASWRTSGGTILGSLRYQSNTGQLHLYVNGTSLVASIGDIASSQWYHIGIDIKIDASSGWVKVYRDKVEVLSTSGNTGNTQIGQVVLGLEPRTANNLYNAYYYYDNIIIDDSTDESIPAIVPEIFLGYVSPDTNGNYSQFTGSDGNSVNNYQLVDEIPSDSADYVSGNSADLVDSYSMGTITIPEGYSITALVPVGVGKKLGILATTLKLGTRLSSTDLVGDAQTLAGTDYSYYERQTSKPGGGSWLQSDLNDVELVIKSSGTYS